MRLEWQIIIALGLDIIFGDPRWFPHPVKGMGRLALALENPMRRRVRNPRMAGILTAGIVIAATAGTAAGLTMTAGWIHPWFADAVSIGMLYTAFAARDLSDHGLAVFQALTAGDLPEARRRVARMVGRDTGILDESGVIRATVESVAENTVDGVIAPLFYAFLGGPVLALAYKAVSTLDSTFGYKDERYLYFGWASARLDDCAAYLPARLTAGIMPLAAACLGLRAKACWRVMQRDGRKHASPNAGLAEAAAAGALGVCLGGRLYKQGHLLDLPEIGDPLVTLAHAHIRRTVSLMWAVLAAAVLLLYGIRFFACG